VGDTLVVYPHDISPVDGTAIDGNGVMNEAFLTGEPFDYHSARVRRYLRGGEW
jgi:cation transport ATPase